MQSVRRAAKISLRTVPQRIQLGGGHPVKDWPEIGLGVLAVVAAIKAVVLRFLVVCEGCWLVLTDDGAR